MKILMPQLGETVNEGTIGVWHKKVGDSVVKNEALLDVETDKAAVEVPVPEDGVIASISVKEGETVDVGTVLAILTIDGEEAEEASAASTSKPVAEQSTNQAGTDILMPQLGETVNEGTISVWHKKVGDTLVKNEALLDVETDKAAVEVPAPADGVLLSINVEAGETVDVGTVLAVVAIEGAVEGATDAPAQTPAPASAPAPVKDTAKDAPKPSSAISSKPAKASAGEKISPAVRRLVADNNIDLGQVAATGKGGRVTRQDVLAYMKAGGIKSALIPPPALAPALLPQLKNELIPFDRIRKLTAEHMVMSKATSPHVLQAVEVNYAAVDAVRKKLGPAWKADKGYSLTYLPFICKALTLAMGEFPRVNASIEGDALQLHAEINLAIAVDLSFEGLVAPVIKDCATKSITELSESIKTLSTKAHAGKLSPDDFAGGTYTISNSGPFGTLMTAPIINQPQVAIISTDGIRKRPVVIESEAGDSIAIRPVGILAQSFDHRAFDGAYSAAFLNRVREILESHNWEAEI